MDLEQQLERIVTNDEIHCRFLNTLSLLENTGARKISANELPETTTLMVLKHAAEEHRHAFYLKKLIARIDPAACPDYQPGNLLAPSASRYYLNKLDTATSRYLSGQLGLSGRQLKFSAYLLVTYAIELRADEIYPVYQKVLDRGRHKVSVKSIIVEEQGHLEEMICQLRQFDPNWEHHAAEITAIENTLYHDWVQDLALAITPD